MSKSLPARRAYLVSEVAALFGVSGQTVRNWLNKGDLRGERIGRIYLVDAREIDSRFPERTAA